MNYKEILTKEFLQKEYTIKKKYIYEIAKDIGCDRKTVYNYCKKYNIDTTTGSNIYDVNENFFEQPNILNSYYAGFIAADGCISQPPGRINRLGIAIHEKDISVLQSMKKDIQFQGPITSRFSRCTFGDINTVKLDIGSNKICDDLCVNFNITPRKSLTLMPPIHLNDEYSFSFIVGLIDGDGSMGLYKNKKSYQLSFSLCGTESVLYWVKQKFNLITYTDTNILNRDKHYRYQVRGKSIYKILSTLNDMDIPKLKRKWDFINKSSHIYELELQKV